MAKKKTKAPAQPKPAAKPEMGDGVVSEDGRTVTVLARDLQQRVYPAFQMLAMQRLPGHLGYRVAKNLEAVESEQKGIAQAINGINEQHASKDADDKPLTESIEVRGKRARRYVFDGEEAKAAAERERAALLNDTVELPRRKLLRSQIIETTGIAPALWNAVREWVVEDVPDDEDEE